MRVSQLTEKAYWERQRTDKQAKVAASLRWLRTYLYHRLHNILYNTLQNKSYQSTLEVGCGGGKWLVYFAKVLGYNVTGVDYAESGIHSAQKAVSFAGQKVDIIHEDIFRYCTIAQHGFDIVFSDGFIEHFHDTEDILCKLSGLVNPGGLLITVVPNLNGLHNLILRWTGNDDKIFKTHQKIRLAELYECYSTLGYQNIKTHTIGSLIPKVFRIPKLFSKCCNIAFRGLGAFGIRVESESISSTYMILGEKTDF